MHNPMLGVVTSEHHSDGGYSGHAGRDIGPRDIHGNRVNGIGWPVYAAFGGWARNIVRWSYPGNRKSTWAKHKTGNGMRIGNPDGEGQGYNHMLPLASIKDGDKIEEGQLIGHLDASGNQSAPHLHFETWGSWKNWRSHYSPKILFDKYGVSTMTDPAPAVIIPAAKPKPKPQEAKLSAAEVRQINAHSTEQADRIVRALRDTRDSIVDAVQTTSKTSAWVVDEKTGEQKEVYLSGLLQRVDSKLTAATEALIELGALSAERLALLSPAVKAVRKD